MDKVSFKIGALQMELVVTATKYKIKIYFRISGLNKARLLHTHPVLRKNINKFVTDFTSTYIVE